MLCYQKITSNQAIEVRRVKEKEFDSFAKTMGKCNQGYCKKKKKKHNEKKLFH